ncbi:myb-related protein b [Phtheirospermum japonicum]|uniref:Myb-related protein b n=1 Tax=Phtheirospermum japonicum TaxID=374723 RepID=A0A830BUV1_9LAMI|nr:myb-related protein b [Phtheirospermum japonicum]
MKKVVNNSSNNSNSDANNVVPKQKERHIVSWSQEEDDILRDQIRVHGTENWTIIASKFKDKTTRQCRRRWFTYLNSDFKKGGWSPEEDMLLCEAQRIFGNRWTEIAKVVSGRTDNAVKNRFTTLCKKRAKREALAKEKSTSSYINLNNKRIIFRNGLNLESAASLKRTRLPLSFGLITKKHQLTFFRTYISGECGVTNNLLRHPFQVLAESPHSCAVDIPNEMQVNTIKEASINNSRRTFLKKDDPKMLALMQQADLLSSLAVKVNSDKTDQSLENAWTLILKYNNLMNMAQVLQDYLKQNEESDMPMIKNSDDLRSSNEGSILSWRDHDAYDSSPASSEYSSGSTMLSNGPADRIDNKCEAEICVLQLDKLDDDDQHCLEEENGMCCTASGNEGI